MGQCESCYYCNEPTNIINYYYKYEHVICDDCINYIRACSSCNKWYTNGVIRCNILCVPCLNNSFDKNK